MKLISLAAVKGGVGKTTLALLIGQYLAQQNAKVLFIDLDHQCNLTHFYECYEDSETVARIFADGGDVSIVSVAPNIDLIPGSMRLDEAERRLETNSNQNMFLYDWLDDYYTPKNLSQYDYVMIDCRPDFGIATRNAIAVSHAVISPVIPSDFAFEGKENLEVRLEQYRKEEVSRPSKESLITAQLFFLPNMIKHNTTKSKELLVALENDDWTLPYIPQKELFNRVTKDNTMIDRMCCSIARSEHREFFNSLEQSLEQIKTMIDSLN